MKKIFIFMMCVLFLIGCGSTRNMAEEVKDTAVEETANYHQEMTYTEKIQSGEEVYDEIKENDFVSAKNESTSTFSIDVDTASYANVRRKIFSGEIPEKDAVRIEEMINYFDYDYPEPNGEIPFSITTMTTNTPWRKDSFVTMIGIQGQLLSQTEIPPSNIVLLLDVSGSMQDRNKLPLLKEAFGELVKNLSNKDRVSIVVYAGASGVVLEGAEGSDSNKIIEALSQLEAGGSTAGAEGIEKAYELAEKYFIQGGNNRVVLATDGDFNVGISTTDGLESLIAQKRDSGVFLSVIGFGSGNIRDDIMETLADKGNGNYSYIDSLLEAKKVFDKEFLGTMYAIAKDVKVQVTFDPNFVESYRLIGYENRILNNEDFNDDRIDAGELGVGHEVTAMYEIILHNQSIHENDNFYDVKLRYKEPDEDESKLIHVINSGQSYYELKNLNSEFTWALAVAEFAMVLRDSKYKEDANVEHVLQMIANNTKSDVYREEFIELVKAYQSLKK